MMMRRAWIFAVAAMAMGLAGCSGGGGGGGGGAGGSGSTSAPPVMTSAQAVTVYAGQTGTFYTATASESGTAAVAYSLSGTDAAKFSINSATGAVSFVAPPNYDTPGDADLDNEYLVNVTATAGTYSTTQLLSVQVTKNVSGAYAWSDAPWGGGSLVTGMIYHPKVAGLLYARTNYGGAFRWNPTSGNWIALTDFGAFGDGTMSVRSIALDPNDGQKVYLAVGDGNSGAILISSDQGATWKKVALPFTLDGSQTYTSTGESLVVDPNDSQVLYLGANGSAPGVYKSVDGGLTWTKLNTPAGILATFIAIDPQSGTPGHASTRIWVGCYISLLKSTDGGATWSGQTYPGYAATPVRAAFDGQGHIYMTFADRYDDDIAMRGSVFKLDTTSNTWSDVSPLVPTSTDQFAYEGLAVDPQHPNTVMVTLTGRATGHQASVYRSTDGGASWNNLTAAAHFSISDSPWLAGATGSATDRSYMVTDVEINPFNSAEAVYNTAFGVYMSSDVTNSGATDWAFKTQGMDLYAAYGMVSPRAGPHLLAVNAFGGAGYTNFSRSDTAGYFKGSFSGGGTVDSAELNPAIALRMLNGSAKGGAISTDSGATWTDFADGTPYFGGTYGVAGVAAVSAKGTSIAWCNSAGKYYSSATNGASWGLASGPSVCNFLLSDRTTDGIFYSLDGANGVIYRSKDAGATFTSFISGLGTDGASRFVVVPWKEGDIWVASSKGLYHIDGTGASAAKLANVTAASLIGYGAPAPGQSVHSLYLSGTVSGVTGIFRSDDNGATWVRINDDLHRFGQVNFLAGDPRVWGRVYLGTVSRGVVLGNRF